LAMAWLLKAAVEANPEAGDSVQAVNAQIV
jgi:hypothetical protein